LTKQTSNLIDVAAILLLPFVLSSIIRFFDAWIYLPAVLVLGMLWFGACVSIVESKKHG